MQKKSKAEKLFCNDSKYPYFILTLKFFGGGVVSHSLLMTKVPRSFTPTPAHIVVARCPYVLSTYFEIDRLIVVETVINRLKQQYYHSNFKHTKFLLIESVA